MSNTFTLGSLKNLLQTVPSDKVFENGFSNPHSYRGYYDQVSFVPTSYVTAQDMLKCVEEALSKTFHGWKGGEFNYDLTTDVWFAERGSCEDTDEWDNPQSQERLDFIQEILGSVSSTTNVESQHLVSLFKNAVISKKSNKKVVFDFKTEAEAEKFFTFVSNL